MTGDLQILNDKLDEAIHRIEQLEERLNTPEEMGARWKFLVRRPHPWRRQLSIKGRNQTVGQLISTLRANQLSSEQASDDLGLPVEAIQEALTYYQENQSLIELEAAEERRYLVERGHKLEP